MIEIFAPRRWYDWVFSLLFWASSVVLLGGAIKVALRGELGEPLLHHVVLAVGISLPFGIIAQLLLAHLDRARGDLARLAATDMLTGLPNRRGFFTALSQPREGVIMLLDVDHFKRVNDTYGHDTGDMVLRAVGDLLSSQVRRGDVVGRIGGEEFAIFLPNAPPGMAREIGERLCRGVRLDLPGGTPLEVTLSAGAAMAGRETEFERILGAADKALYRAKESGRARLVFRARTSVATFV